MKDLTDPQPTIVRREQRIYQLLPSVFDSCARGAQQRFKAARNSLELQSVPTRESPYTLAEPPLLQPPSYIVKCELGRIQR